LLFPSYLYISEELALERAQLSELEASLAQNGQGDINARFTRLNEHAKRLLTFSQTPAASDALERLLEVPHANVALSGFSVDAAVGNVRQGKISGIADSREALRVYHQALTAVPFVTKADLPLSAYAKEADIPFSILLTLTLTP
jgi:hypothetical protein